MIKYIGIGAIVLILAIMDKTFIKKDKVAEVTSRSDGLSEIQYQVTKQDGTEPAYKNEYWDNHEEGTYVDVIDGTPLFSSEDKYDSGTGWPSFTKPISKNSVMEKEDYKLGVKRVEVRSKSSDSHLGHVFDDGPADKWGLRYCMNSAALRFVPKNK